MTDLVVVRGSGSSQGEDILDALLSTDAAAMARGRAALDDGSGLHPVPLECVYRDGLVLGQLVELYNPLTLEVHFGKITSITHQYSVTGVTTSLIVQVPSEFLV